MVVSNFNIRLNIIFKTSVCVCPTVWLTQATFEEKNCLGRRIKYYNSIDICYSKNIVNNVEIRTLLFF